MSDFNPHQHFETAKAHIARADDWANRDRVDPEFRPVIVDYNLRLAQIHATLAVAERLDALIGLVFDEGRSIKIDDGRP